MTEKRRDELLNRMADCGVVVIGDFCLDAYWTLDSEASEVSVETGKPAHAVRSQSYSLGGAGNVVQNLVDLGVGRVHAIGVVGDDLFGREMRALLRARAVESEGLLVQAAHWATPVYAKPFINDEELSRFDWGAFNEVSTETEDALVAALARSLKSAGAVVINQQLSRGGPYRGKLIEKLNALIRKHADVCFIVDSRQVCEAFEGAILKVNDVEAARLTGQESLIGTLIPIDDVRRSATALFDRTGQPVFVTRGANGIVTYDGRTMTEVPGLDLLGPIDSVGAGDTCVAAIAAALAAGATREEAARLGNFAAAVTVQKVRQTGSARPDEIRAIAADPNYVYRPELAVDERAARFWNDTEIEVINDEAERGRISHALFDHDGTISTLREGWEAIMAPMCVRAILGDAVERVSRDEYQRIAERVKTFIDKTTGIQTIVQMEFLVELVREAGYVHADEIDDRFGYKATYNEALMERVNVRLAKIERGELSVDDFTLKGAVAFLRRLRDRGVKLYLASGTDCEDVKREAEAFGYDDVFEGRIYGSVGDVKKYSKKKVIDEILRTHRLEGAQLVCFGDGPVELRETKKRGGITIGICSDEVRRYGRDDRKRERLIRAGADVIVPDFSQADRLTAWLFPS